MAGEAAAEVAAAGALPHMYICEVYKVYLQSVPPQWRPETPQSHRSHAQTGSSYPLGYSVRGSQGIRGGGGGGGGILHIPLRYTPYTPYTSQVCVGYPYRRCHGLRYPGVPTYATLRMHMCIPSARIASMAAVVAALAALAANPNLLASIPN